MCSYLPLKSLSRLSLILALVLMACSRDAELYEVGTNITQLSLSEPPHTIIVGERHKLEVTVTPDRDMYYLLEWTSSNPEVLPIDKYTGEVVAEGAGKVTVTVTDRASKLSDTVEIEVRPFEGVTLTDEGILKVGVPKAGMLAEYLAKADKPYEGLELLGNLNGDDINTLRQLKVALPKGLNLRGANIVSGGSPIKGSYEGKSYEYNVEDKVIGPYMFCRSALAEPALFSGELFLPQSVTLIDTYAFADTDVTKVRLARDNERIGLHAFRRCQKLTKIDFKEGQKLKYLGGFAETSSLALLDSIPHGVLEISDYAFYKSGLRGLVLNYGCYSITAENKLSKGQFYNFWFSPLQLQRIGKYAFSRVVFEPVIDERGHDPSSLDFPPSLKIIDEGAFQNATFISHNTSVNMYLLYSLFFSVDSKADETDPTGYGYRERFSLKTIASKAFADITGALYIGGQLRKWNIQSIEETKKEYGVTIAPDAFQNTELYDGRSPSSLTNV
ncbi:Bacterial Ig-like domain (group 2) [Chlamydia trachomatis]|nr:Bacterial Ig-like domain (group 2) [Chlamydia trachomatis]